MYSGCRLQMLLGITGNYLGFCNITNTGRCQRISWSSLKIESFEYEILTLCSLEMWW